MRQPIRRSLDGVASTPAASAPAAALALTSPASQTTPAPQPIANPSPSPSDVIAVDHSDGLRRQPLQQVNFKKAPTAPLSIEAMNTKAFPAPQTKYSDVEYLQQLFQSMERTLAARNKMDTAQIAMQIIQSTDATSVAALPEEAIKLFLTAADFGFNVDTSRVTEVKSDVIKKAEADRVLEDLFGDDSDFLSM